MKKILIINPFGVGDVLFTTPVIDALKKRFPDSFIGYLCQKQTAAILENHPLVDKLFSYTRGDLKQARKRSRLEYIKMFLQGISEISNERFDLALDLSMVSQYGFLLWMIGVKQRFGFDYKKRGIFLTHKIKVAEIGRKHIIEYYLDLLRLLSIKKIDRKLKFYTALKDRQFADNFFDKHNVNENDLLIGIAPFGGGSWGKDSRCKQWPDERFAGIMTALLREYDCKLVIFGTSKNADDCAVFKEVLRRENVIDALGKTSLGQLAAMIGNCGLFISNDSGPMHIACAKGVDTVSIFGPVDESVYGPVGVTACHEIVKADIECRPCYKNFKKPDCENLACLVQISEDKVLNAVHKVLKFRKIKRSNKK